MIYKIFSFTYLFNKLNLCNYSARVQEIEVQEYALKKIPVLLSKKVL